LIVIVVIGILAAITIVSYTGITQQAHDSANQQDASSIVSVAEAFNARTGAYPTTSADFTNADNVTKLPGNIAASITTGAVTGSEGTSPCSDTNQTWAACVNTTTGVKTISVKACGASVGVNVYYLKGSGNTLMTAKAGAGC
jgi:type II secretory pathway pseudopilin PulG